MIFKQIHKKILVCLIIFTVFISPAHGTGLQTSRVFDIEAAFLIRFTKYITWPESSFKTLQSPIKIGIVGRDPFGTKIDKMARTFKDGNRPVEILRIDSEMTGADKCHILFISPESINKMAEIEKNIAGKPILLVSNTPGFLKQGGIINFIIAGTKIRFNISLTNGRQMGLKISSKLLRVAKKVL